MHFCLFFEVFGEYLFSLLVYVVFSGNMLSVKYIIDLCSRVEMGNPLRMRVKPETKGRASEREKSGVEKVGILVIIVRKEFASTSGTMISPNEETIRTSFHSRLSQFANGSRRLLFLRQCAIRHVHPEKVLAQRVPLFPALPSTTVITAEAAPL